MATVYATKSGSWSDTTVWNTGALPTSSDDVYCNNYNIEINQNITVLSLRNTAAGGGGSGGWFSVSAARTINVGTLVMQSSTSYLIITQNPTSTTTTINVTNAITGAPTSGQAIIIVGGNLQGGNVNISAPSVTWTSTGAYGIANIYTGTLTFTGNVLGSTTSLASGGAISVQNGSLIVVGNVTGGSINLAYGINMTNSAVSATVTGNVTGGTTGNSYGINCTAGNVTVTGAVNNSTANGINMSSAANNLTITGNVTSTSVNAISLATNGTVSITGTIQAGSVAALNSTSLTATHLLSGPFIASSGIQPILANKVYLTSASTYWTMTTSTATSRTLSTNDQLTGFPSSSNVRSGTLYGVANALSGTLVIPSASDVRVSVPVDNITGSATLTPQDLFDAITNSTSGVGLRLKNVATVATVGQQIASYPK